MTIIFDGRIHENPAVVPPWTALSATDTAIPGQSLALVSDPAGSGRTVGAFTRRSTDTLVSSGYRVEVSNVGIAWNENVERWMHWRTYIPSDQKFQLRPATICFQIHDQSTGEAAHPPPLECEITPHHLLFLGAYDATVTSTTESITTYEVARIPMIWDAWVDFVLHCRFNVAASSGFFRLWVNHREILHLRNIPNAYAHTSGIDPVYIQMGNYTGGTVLPNGVTSRTLYHDGLRMGDATSGYRELTGRDPEPALLAADVQS